MKGMPRNVAAATRGKLEQLATDPFAPNNNVKKLEGRPVLGYAWGIGELSMKYRMTV